jgi:hypothetical protein
LLFVVGGAEVAAVGVAAVGVVVDGPGEDFSAVFVGGGPGFLVVEEFSFQGGVEGLGQGVVRALTG